MCYVTNLLVEMELVVGLPMCVREHATNYIQILGEDSFVFMRKLSRKLENCIHIVHDMQLISWLFCKQDQ